MPLRLEGKVAVITGAASGIGRATLELFVREGARVVAADIAEEAGKALAESFNGKVVFQRCDVMKETDIAAAVEKARNYFGGLDVYFSNAGTTEGRDTAEGVVPENFDRMMRQHVLASLLGMKYASAVMKKAGGGSFITTASTAGMLTGFGPMLYGIAKSAVIHMTHIAATQLAPYNIRVNCISPGLIATPIFGRAAGFTAQEAENARARVEDAAKRFQPMPRGGRAEDIANGALFLADDKSTFVTGINLPVDGGLACGTFGEWQEALYKPVFDALGAKPKDKWA
jgi:NAD(P)-dependent dehydrogenase (short-subunit alcohol dehydrogenase family)